MRRFCLTHFTVLVAILVSFQLASAVTLLSEGFDDVPNLPVTGWYMINHSNPEGITDWFNGDDTLFPAETGAVNAYAAASYNSTSGAGTISNWLLSPVLDFSVVDEISFYTRTVDAPAFPDHLEVRVSNTGTSIDIGTAETDIGDFTTLLVDINPSLTITDYPSAWTKYTIQGGSLPASGTGRIAFRYFVTDGGPDGTNSDYIGIDTFEVLANVYTLTYTAGANGSITGPTPQTVDYGADGATVTAVPAPNYHFVNWSDGSTANPRTDTNVTANISVTANFAIDNNSVVLLSEGFEDVPNLPVTGWYMINHSDPAGITDWFNGDDTLFPAQAGAPTAYAAASYNSTLDVGTISNWLLSPVLDFTTVGQVSFWTRTVGAPVFPDHLEVRVSNAGSSIDIGTLATEVGDFTSLVVDINPGLTVVDYPVVWTQYTVSSGNLPATGTGRIAFRYFVTDGGPGAAATNSDYIGIDTFEVLANYSFYTLSYTAGDHGSITGTTPQTVNYGENGTEVTAVPDPNYHFVNWSDGSTVNPRTDLNVTANIFVTANFAIDTFTLTYNTDGNGTINGNTSQNVDYGGSGTAVNAVPTTGYHFVNWSDGSTDNPRTDTNVTADVTVTANFAIDTFTLAYDTDGNGTINGTTPQTVNYGASGTAVEAIANANYHFVNWSDGSTVNPRTDTNVTADVTVTANFAIDTYTLTVSTTGSGAGSVTSDVPGIDCGVDCTEVYNYGTVVMLTAAPEPGSRFKGWSGDCTGADTTCTVTMDQARNVTALFNPFSWNLFLPSIVNNGKNQQP